MEAISGGRTLHLLTEEMFIFDVRRIWLQGRSSLRFGGLGVGEGIVGEVRRERDGG